MDLEESIRRCLALLPLLRRPGGMTMDELARMTGLPADRVLQELGDIVLLCGVPPYYPHNYVGLYVEGDRICARDADQFRRPVRLTLEEALALNLALRAYTRSPEHPFAKAAAGIRDKILSIMPAREREQLGRLERSVDVRVQEGPVERKIAKLREAMAKNLVCHLVYYTAGRHELNERDVRPYGLVEHRGTWYLVAHCEKRDREIPFRVDRIRSIELLDRGYDVPDDFDVARYRRDEMYVPGAEDLTVRVRFDAEVARWIKESSPRGTVRPGPKGTVIRTLKTNQPRWVVDWVLQYAPHAEILEPASVRELMRTVCREVLEAYDAPTPTGGTKRKGAKKRAGRGKRR
jgi:proteasome accessory factor C